MFMLYQHLITLAFFSSCQQWNILPLVLCFLASYRDFITSLSFHDSEYLDIVTDHGPAMTIAYHPYWRSIIPNGSSGLQSASHPD
jgi:hypothetical protein